jgi:hypothetical protein
VSVVDDELDLDEEEDELRAPAFARARAAEPEPEPVRVQPRVETPRRKIVFEDSDDLDVPDFLK